MNIKDKLLSMAHSAYFATHRQDLLIAAAELEALQKENAELKIKNIAWALGIEQNNTDIVDMQRDEFRRVIALTDNSEIKNICERAIACIEQTVPVVVQRDSLRSTVAELKHDIEAYRGALGYPVHEFHDGRLTNGEKPQCGLARGWVQRSVLWLASESAYWTWRLRIGLIHKYGNPEVITRNEDKMLSAARRWNW